MSAVPQNVQRRAHELFDEKRRNEQSREAWTDPLTLSLDVENVDYPLDALPGSLGGAVREVADFVLCPPALAACSGLAALSLSAQHLANVQRGSDLEGPTSLYLLAVAESGERKSECDRRFTLPLRDWEAERLEQLAPEIREARANLAAWESQREGVLQAIKTAQKNNEAVADSRRTLHELEHGKPRPARIPRLLMESETAESLAWNLARPDGWPSGGIMSSEAGAVFGSHGMRRESISANLALLNKLWDGGSLSVGRRTSDQFRVSGARLTMGLAVQPDTVQAFFEDAKGLARGTGFMARFLVAYPRSTQGTRFYRDAPAGWPQLKRCQYRLRELLDMPAQMNDRGELTPVSMPMEPAAFAAWKQFHDGIEAQLRPTGELAEVRDVASKAADNCARLAALFHVFEHGPAGDLAALYVQSAARIVTWHLYEARRFFGSLAVPKALRDAQKLGAWLVERCRSSAVEAVKLREIQQRGPYSVRRKADLFAALTQLAEADWTRLDEPAKAVRINPALLRA